ncbi:MAG TPA: hypothetical protein VK694_01250 [Verrucomicrobiae bacterium]|nr:hypothetical protein [Verrucomicrobiae bacterium]
MRQDISDRYVGMVCSGAYLDLALHPDTPSEEALGLVDQAFEEFHGLDSDDWEKASPEELSYLYRTSLYEAYASKYKKTLIGDALNLADEIDLYNRFLYLAHTMVDPAPYLTEGAEVRGVQFEASVHLLNARFNVRHRGMLQSAWPSLPREDDPHDFKRASTAWDIAVSTVDFMDQSERKLVQLKAVKDSSRYDPAITVIVGKTHLYTQNSEDILRTAIQESYPSSETHRTQAEAKMNMHERYLMERLGWQFTDD